ncbi:LamG domain-containing protein [Candidatus Micrarchaeota archaeon]|nr:LamG domain-containing protein [Candidatus Micrarchaeota archaeon]MBU1930361.1 LamG domain-containing protein [Candidatus Micrarchaeota archaeon]
MNNKALLTEPIFLIVVAVMGAAFLSGVYQLQEDSTLAAAQSYYDVTTKWQDLRFILEQETVNQILENIDFVTDCEFTSFTPDYSSEITYFNTPIEPNLECTANLSSDWTEPFFTVSGDLTCANDTPPNGIKASFAQNISIQKEIQLTSGSCIAKIIDVPSGVYDIGEPEGPGGNKTCAMSLSPNPIFEGGSTSVTVTFDGFTGIPDEDSFSCNDLISGDDSLVCTATECTAMCGAYTLAASPTPEDFTISATISEGADHANCSADITVEALPANLEAFWTFDESTGNFLDLTGQYNLTPSSLTEIERGAGKIGNAVNLNSANEDFVYNNTDFLDLSGNFSIMFWTNQKNQPNETIFSQCDSDGTNCVKITTATQGQMDIRINNQTWNTLQIVPANWAHIAFTLNGIQGTLYVNGHEIESHTFSSAPYQGNDGQICVGAFCQGTVSQYLTGKVDHMSVWSDVLAESYILTQYLEGEPLAFSDGYWEFEEKSSGAYYNSVTEEYDLVSNGLQETWGLIGNGAGLDQDPITPTILGIGPVIDLRKTDFSVTAWVNLDMGNNPTLFSQCPLINIQKQCLQILTKRDLVFFDFGGDRLEYYWDYVNPLLPTNMWHHVAFTYDYDEIAGNTGTRKIFVNGISVAQDSTSPPFEGVAIPFCFGAWCKDADFDPVADYFEGRADNLHVYRHALDQGEIDVEVAEGEPPVIIGPKIAQWNLDETSQTFTDASGYGFTLYGQDSQSVSGVPGIVPASNGIGLNEIPATSPNDLPGQYATMPHNMDLSTDDFSISLWYKPYEDIDPYCCEEPDLIAQCPDLEQLDGACLEIQHYTPQYYSTSQIRFAFNRNWGAGTEDYSETPVGKYVVATNAWNHITVTYNKTNNTRSIFLNGQQIVTNDPALGSFNVPPSIFNIGKIQFEDAERHWTKGKIDEVTIWNQELDSTTVPTVQDLYNNGKEFEGLIKHYKFEDISGPFFKNEVTDTPDLFFSGVSQEDDSWGKAAELDGRNFNSFMRGTNLNLAGKSYSISLWIKPTSTGDGSQDLFSLCPRIDYDNRCIETQFDLEGESYPMAISFLTHDGEDPTPEVRTSNYAITPNVWNHVVIVMNYTNILNPTKTIYVNKTPYPAGGESVLRAFEGDSASFCLGIKCHKYTNWPNNLDNYATKNYYFEGRMDEVRIYTKALNTTEINCLYSTPEAAC